MMAVFRPLLRIRMTLPVFVVAAAVFSSQPAIAGDFDLGLKAFRAGDLDQALKEWVPLAEAGDADAQHALGQMCEYGRGVASDDQLAATWYRSAAYQGQSDAQYRLGVLHEHGWGVSRDATMAAELYERAAQNGHAFAQHDLAFMYLNGTGRPQDRIQAYKWLRIASTQRADLMEKHLKLVAESMSPAEIRAAEKLAAAWLNSQKV